MSFFFKNIFTFFFFSYLHLTGILKDGGVLNLLREELGDKCSLQARAVAKFRFRRLMPTLIRVSGRFFFSGDVSTHRAVKTKKTKNKEKSLRGLASWRSASPSLPITAARGLMSIPRTAPVRRRSLIAVEGAASLRR